MMFPDLHPDDQDILGLRSLGYPYNGSTDAGTTTKVRGRGVVQVTVHTMPCVFFYTFTVTRPSEDPELSETFVINTGSGRFTEFWPVAKLLAENAYSVSAA